MVPLHQYTTAKKEKKKTCNCRGYVATKDNLPPRIEWVILTLPECCLSLIVLHKETPMVQMKMPYIYDKIQYFVLPAKVTICCRYKNTMPEFCHPVRMPRRSRCRCGLAISAIINDRHVKRMLPITLMTKRMVWATAWHHHNAHSQVQCSCKLKIYIAS